MSKTGENWLHAIDHSFRIKKFSLLLVIVNSALKHNSKNKRYPTVKLGGYLVVLWGHFEVGESWNLVKIVELNFAK